MATGAKLNQTSNFRFGDASDLAHLVTTPDAPSEVLAAFEADPDVRVIVFQGAGDKAFVSGADISQFDSARANRDVSSAGIGNDLADPFIDYSSLAKAYGVHGQGPIDNPNDLGPALKRAIEVVKRGEPALVDVLTQPR